MLELTSQFMSKLNKFQGIIWAAVLIILWSANLAYWINADFSWSDPWVYIAILFQTHLYTGLFITSHDAIHGVVYAENSRLNHAIGRFCTLLFAFNDYSTLRSKHHLHHAHVNTDNDPDVHQGPFLFWWFKFIWQYVTWKQVLAMAITYNILKLWFPMWNLILFWELPAILSTLQLFIFGTYLPHRGEHAPENKQQSRSQGKNHVWAFISCYFFGYHYEHHAHPYLPWYKLPKAKDESLA